jgi:hypothetical protein
MLETIRSCGRREQQRGRRQRQDEGAIGIGLGFRIHSCQRGASSSV